MSAYSDTAIGVSNCRRSTSASAIQSAAASISAVVSAILARGTTIMLLSPSGCNDDCCYTCAGVCTSCDKPAIHTFISTAASSISPKGSAPTLPISVTSAPSRAAAVAWLNPFPPVKMSKASPMMFHLYRVSALDMADQINIQTTNNGNFRCCAVHHNLFLPFCGVLAQMRLCIGVACKPKLAIITQVATNRF